MTPGQGGFIDYREYDLAMASGRATSRRAKAVRGKKAPPKTTRKHIVYRKLYCKEKPPHPAVSSREKSLAIQFARSIQSSDDIDGVYSMQSMAVLDIAE
jgi:hypothetical protein